MDTVAPSTIGFGRQTWNFARHFLEMCVSMCAGGAILSLVVFAGIPALTGGGDLRRLFPELSILAIAVFLTLPMTAWMWYRGMPWRPTLEMAAVGIGLAILLIGLVLARLLPASALQIEFGAFCGLVCVGMFGVMLFRLDLYAGRTGHHGAHAGHG